MLADLAVKDFLEKTASGDPVPGGGSVAALAAAVSASLCRMVAALTIGKKGYEDHDPDMRDLAEKAEACRRKLIQDIDRDSEAYRAVIAAYRMPRETEDEKKERSRAVQAGLKKAALVPLGVARDAFELMDMAGTVIRRGNRNAVTDGAVAAMMARTAVLSALYNVRINLSSIKDRDFTREVTVEIDRMEKDILEKEKRALSRVEI